MKIWLAFGAFAILCVTIGYLARPSSPVEKKSEVAFPKDVRHYPMRSTIMVACDTPAQTISRKAVDTTISKFLAIPRPADFPIGEPVQKYDTTRANPLETTVWRVHAQLDRISQREDGDIYLILLDENDRMAVAEIPEPDPVLFSPFSKEMTQVREKLQAKFRPRGRIQKVGTPVTLEGIGFYGQETPRFYSNPTGARIMPVLSIEFK